MDNSMLFVTTLALAFLVLVSAQVALSPCSPNPCDNGGQCSFDDIGKTACTCQAGYTGDNCENQAPSGGFGDPHIVAHVTGSDEPLCYSFHGNNNQVVQLFHDSKTNVTVNGELYIPGAPPHSYFRNIAVVVDQCSVIAGLQGIKVREGKQLSWHESVKDLNCGSASINLLPSSHLVVKTSTDTEFTIVLEHRRVHGQYADFLDVFLSKRGKLSKFTTGLIGQFEGMTVTVDVIKPAEAALLSFPLDPSKPAIHAKYQHKRSALQGRVGCWFVAKEGKGLIQGVPKDYAVPALTWNKDIPNPFKM